jgi:hypothetical protein
VSVLQAYNRCEDVDEKEMMRQDIAKLMKYAHVFLPVKEGEPFNELTKPIMCINSAAVKHILLHLAEQHPGSYQATSGTPNLSLLAEALKDLAEGRESHTKHYFLPDHINIWSIAAYAFEYVENLRSIACKQSKLISDKISGKV